MRSASGSANVFVGVNTGLDNSTGFENSFMGFQAGASKTTGDAISFVGVSFTNTSGRANALENQASNIDALKAFVCSENE